MNAQDFSRPLIDMEATGLQIRHLRMIHQISVRELQGILGYTNPQFIYNWEQGKNMPSIDNLLALSFLFDVSINEILKEKPIPG